MSRPALLLALSAYLLAAACGGATATPGRPRRHELRRRTSITSGGNFGAL